ncbi:Uma2 family endonuclease [Acidobacteria bacterium AB60]|nr:Uma2 family endonuclease [Acidobacteria bacterium AB60]
MSATTHISEQQYLHSTFEPDAEYVDGEVRTRSMPTYSHADWQLAIATWFVQHAREWNIRCVPELRVRVRPGAYRVPDVSVLDRANPKEEIVTVAPLAVFEVLSPDDTVQELYEKLDDYTAMGIPQIWVADPKTGAFKQYCDQCLKPASRFSLPQRGIEFDTHEIASLLQN